MKRLIVSHPLDYKLFIHLQHYEKLFIHFCSLSVWYELDFFHCVYIMKPFIKPMIRTPETLMYITDEPIVQEDTKFWEKSNNCDQNYIRCWQKTCWQISWVSFLLIPDISYVSLRWYQMHGNYTRVQNKYKTLWFWFWLLRQPAIGWIAIAW